MNEEIENDLVILAERVKQLEELNKRLTVLAKRFADNHILNMVVRELGRHKNVCWLIRDKQEMLYVIGQFLAMNQDNISFHNNGMMKFKQGNTLVICDSTDRIKGLTIDVVLGMPEEDYNLLKGILPELPIIDYGEELHETT